MNRAASAASAASAESPTAGRGDAPDAHPRLVTDRACPTSSPSIRLHP